MLGLSKNLVDLAGEIVVLVSELGHLLLQEVRELVHDLLHFVGVDELQDVDCLQQADALLFELFVLTIHNSIEYLNFERTRQPADDRSEASS